MFPLHSFFQTWRGGVRSTHCFNRSIVILRSSRHETKWSCTKTHVIICEGKINSIPIPQWNGFTITSPRFINQIQNLRRCSIRQAHVHDSHDCFGIFDVHPMNGRNGEVGMCVKHLFRHENRVPIRPQLHIVHGMRCTPLLFFESTVFYRVPSRIPPGVLASEAMIPSNFIRYQKRVVGEHLSQRIQRFVIQSLADVVVFVVSLSQVYHGVWWFFPR